MTEPMPDNPHRAARITWGTLLAAITVVLASARCSRPTGNREQGCASCPACAASMRCFSGATLHCAPELYSPIDCRKASGLRHGQHKRFDFEHRADGAGRWIETDGWYIDGEPVGTWTSRDAIGRVVRVETYAAGALSELQWLRTERHERYVNNHVQGQLEAKDGGNGTPYFVYCSTDDAGCEVVTSDDTPFDAGDMTVPDPMWRGHANDGGAK